MLGADRTAQRAAVLDARTGHGSHFRTGRSSSAPAPAGSSARTSWRGTATGRSCSNAAREVNDRIRDVKAFDDGGPFHPESNYLFGEGGAGTFSDGKLTCRGTGPDVLRVLELFAECKGQQPGKPSILYYHRPHLGSNRLPAVVKAHPPQDRGLRRRGAVPHPRRRPAARRVRRLKGVNTSSGFIPASVVVLAIGHSARDTYRMLARRGVPMTPKPFQFGVRIEHRQEVVNAVQFGPRHDAVRGTARQRRLLARRPAAATTCSRSACAPAGTSSRACRRKATSARTA